MEVKKTSKVEELKKIMKQDMDDNEKTVSKKKIKKIMEEFVE